MRKNSESRLRANAKYDRLNTRRLNVKLNIHTDEDILAHLDQMENKSGYIKELIRRDMKAR